MGTNPAAYTVSTVENDAVGEFGQGTLYHDGLFHGFRHIFHDVTQLSNHENEFRLDQFPVTTHVANAKAFAFGSHRLESFAVELFDSLGRSYQ